MLLTKGMYAAKGGIAGKAMTAAAA